MKRLWEAKCPCCDTSLYYEGVTDKDMVRNVGASLDCPKCGALLVVTKDLKLDDLGAILVKDYQDAGLHGARSEEHNV